jgi:hypothetical protein
MSHVHERPPGANAADPSIPPEMRAAPTDARPSAPREEREERPPWEPSNPTRWAHLNLSDPPETGILPPDALVPDALAWALAQLPQFEGSDQVISGT